MEEFSMIESERALNGQAGDEEANITRKKEEEEEEEEEEDQTTMREEEEVEGSNKTSTGGFFINSFISNLVSPREGKKGIFRKGEAQDEEDGRMKLGETAEMASGGGGSTVVNNFISNFFKRSHQAHDDEADHKGNEEYDKDVLVVLQGRGDHDDEIHTRGEEEEEDQRALVKKEEDDQEGGGGTGTNTGGIINNIISNLFHSNDQEAEAHDHDQQRGEEAKLEEEKKGQEKSGGVGIINNFVSSLPASLQGNVAPATDEASILIHSIIHD